MDAKAKKILLNTYWRGGRWKEGGPSCTDEDFEYAKRMGVMFDPVTTSHDECVLKLRELHEHKITKEKVVCAFLHSLSTRKVYLRSALSSFALTRDLPVHTFGERKAEAIHYCSCHDCNERKLMSDEQYVDQDVNVLNFERIKWGGVRLNRLLYCLLDLELLSREEDLTVTDEDVSILKSMVQAIEDCSAQDAARQLEKRWKDLFSGNQYERDFVMEIWGYAGLLQSNDKYRKERGRGGTDFMSMATWRGEDGYTAERMSSYFGAYL